MFDLDMLKYKHGDLQSYQILNKLVFAKNWNIFVKKNVSEIFI